MGNELLISAQGVPDLEWESGTDHAKELRTAL
jgi:hypothetical protein